MSAARQLLLLLLLALFACTGLDEALDAEPGGANEQGPPQMRADRGIPLAPAPPPPGPSGPADPNAVQSYIIIQDVTEGFAIDEFFGVEIDAVLWRCPDDRGSGYGISVEDPLRSAEAEPFSLDPIIGPPDGPCAERTSCAGFLGLEGSVAVGVAVADLRGCEIEVHELADNPDEKYRITPCENTYDCNVFWMTGTDGEVSGGVYE